MVQSLKKRIQSLLPFRNMNGARHRIERLQHENKKVVKTMSELSNYYKQVIPEPRELYLTVQEVRSSTVYIRWRKKGVRGKQKYLIMDSIEGRGFLLQQTLRVRDLYREYNNSALQLNLAHSLRVNEIKRIAKYLDSLTFTD
jgi:hypothetical protein